MRPMCPSLLRSFEMRQVACLPLLLPHARVNSEARSSKPSTLIPTKCLRVSGFRLRVAIRSSKQPQTSIRTAMSVALQLEV